MIDYNKVINYEVNFLTEESVLNRDGMIRAIKAEFDLIRLWQGMIRPLGYEASTVLDCFEALSLRKLLCDEKSMIKIVCPDFKMPPLDGTVFNCPGDEDSMKLVAIETNMQVKPREEWIPLNEWLNERIAWIEKGINDIPEAFTDWFYMMLYRKLSKYGFAELFYSENIDNKRVWILKEDNSYKEKLYTLLKDNGYYDLTIGKMIRHIADKKGAHLDAKRISWIGMENRSNVQGYSAISVFAIHMMYAASLQIHELKDYFEISPLFNS